MNNRTSRLLPVLAVLLLAAGAAVLLYPRFTAWQYRRGVARRHETFTRATPGDPLLEQLYQELVRRNEELYATRQSELTDPFSYEQPAVSLEDYGLEDGVIGFLQIPALDLELPILLGANEQNLEKGTAHLTQTSYPVGGPNTNCVLAAHRGYYRAPMLREVERLDPDSAQEALDSPED